MFGRLNRYDWPMGSKWDAISFYHAELNKITRQYTLQIEKSVDSFVSTSPATYRFVLIRWNRDPSFSPATQREVLGEYTDLDEIIGVLKLLVANEKEKVNERRT